MSVEYQSPGHPVVLHDLLEPVEVHQAAGMVMVQLGVGSAEAIARLRDCAAECNRSLVEVARAVIVRELRFRP